MTRFASLVSIASLAAVMATAAPARADEEAAKREARALVREGNRLLAAHDAAGAVSLFITAYGKFPSAKILVNLGSAEKELGHSAAAANAYARYLAAGDDDDARTKEIKQLLAALDRDLGRVAITVAPADAELVLDDGMPAPADALAEWRARPGTLRVRARREGFIAGGGTVTITRGAVAQLTLTLAAAPELDVAPPPPSRPPSRAPSRARQGAHTQLGVAGKVVVDGQGRGAAGVVGAVVGWGPLSLDVAAIVGPTFGGYGGVRLALTERRLRPVVSAGMLVFFDDGTRLGARAAAGLEWRASPHLRMLLEIGGEYLFTRADDIDRWALAPALAAEVRL